MARDLLADIGWRPLISHRFPIERAAEAYRLIDERPEETVQVLFAYV
jgi:threonine dehydrogenase-like Zn-dependent dehydrogenase